MSSATPSFANWQDLFIVARWDGGATFNSYDGLFTGTSNSDEEIGIIGNSGTSSLYTTNWFDNFYLNGSSSGTSEVLATMSSPFLVSASSNSKISITGYNIGIDRAFYTSGRDWDGVIAEVISFNNQLSTSKRQKVEAYLAHKWGLSDSLPSTHPLTYLSVGEIELFPPAQINTADYGDAIDLDGNTIELPFQIEQSAGSAGFTAAIWTTPNSVDGVANNPSILLSTKDEGYDWSLGFKSGNPFVRTGNLRPPLHK